MKSRGGSRPFGSVCVGKRDLCWCSALMPCLQREPETACMIGAVRAASRGGLAMRRVCFGLVGAGLCALLSVMARAEDASSGDLERAQLARAIAVLRLQPDAA